MKDPIFTPEEKIEVVNTSLEVFFDHLSPEKKAEIMGRSFEAKERLMKGCIKVESDRLTAIASTDSINDQLVLLELCRRMGWMEKKTP